MCENLDQKGFDTDIIDLADEDIPFWHEGAWNKSSDLSKRMTPYQERVEEADGLILLAAEWAGMVPAALKNFLLYLSAQQCAHKPALIVGVSSGRGGKYPMTELRISGYKNNRMLYLPDHLIVQDCEKVMNDSDLTSGSEADQYIKKRADHTLGVLATYAKYHKMMRDEAGDKLSHPDYPFGM